MSTSWVFKRVDMKERTRFLLRHLEGLYGNLYAEPSVSYIKVQHKFPWVLLWVTYKICLLTGVSISSFTCIYSFVETPVIVQIL